MIHSLLIGLAGGMRAMTPLAAVALAAQSRALPRDNGAPPWLGNTAVTAGATALAVGELLADKHHSSPDRIIPPGIAARLLTGALAGAALAPRQHREAGAALGAIGAVVSAYVTFNARIRSMERHSQVSTGLVEDAVMLATTALAVSGVTQTRRPSPTLLPAPSRQRLLPAP